MDKPFAPIRSVHIFCQVVDNFGDIGVCWRMARQIAEEYSYQVTLWVDDLHSFARICAAVNPRLQTQNIDQVRVYHWTADAAVDMTPDKTGDLVIEGFGCTLPDAYVTAMSQRSTMPFWLNVEYLSAEDWVEGCHGLVSLHPSLPLKKYFFFPGFSEKTGGLLMDQKTLQAKAVFDQDPQNRQEYFMQRNIPINKNARYISVFCYPHAPLKMLLESLHSQHEEVVLIIPENTATEALTAFCGQPLCAGERIQKDCVTICCLPFSDQSDFDKLLWACDMNFVRGEDSFVRAQWAGKPFIWQIYPQEDKVHLAKLDAFLGHYTKAMPQTFKEMIHRLSYSWNGENGNSIQPSDIACLSQNLAQWDNFSQEWSIYLHQNADLVTNIISFCRNKLK